jgi:hypothetical protein
MHIHDTLQFEHLLMRPRRSNRPSKFLAARDHGFTALWCYAKITPAALQRGNFSERRGGGAEAAGRISKFGLSD